MFSTEKEVCGNSRGDEMGEIQLKKCYDGNDENFTAITDERNDIYKTPIFLYLNTNTDIHSKQ